MANDPASISAEDVQTIAHLARLDIPAESIPATAENLSAIIDFVGQLEAADVSQCQPMAHPLDLTQRLRPDQVSEENQREKFQACAPAVSEGLYLVPKVID